MAEYKMTRAEAYSIIGKIREETFSIDEAQALSIAMADIEFVDLMPDDVWPVTRCQNCKHSDMIGNTRYCFQWERNTDDNGFCHEGV